MAVPRNRHSRSRTRLARSHNALKTGGVTACRQCGASKTPHRACPGCGTYRGRQVVKAAAGSE